MNSSGAEGAGRCLKALHSPLWGLERVKTNMVPSFARTRPRDWISAVCDVALHRDRHEHVLLIAKQDCGMLMFRVGREKAD